ncbi:MAG TPA: type II toxin-antitoxin system VapC family toxin [Acidisarcina sp.]
MTSRLYMLDTNTVSYIVKGRSAAARARLSGLQGVNVACISVITEGELLYGMARSGVAEHLRVSLERFLARLNVQPWNRAAAASYGTLRAKQESVGKTLGPLDMLIAAHAIALGATLVSNDRAFQHVPDLAGVENWASDI